MLLPRVRNIPRHRVAAQRFDGIGKQVVLVRLDAEFGSQVLVDLPQLGEGRRVDLVRQGNLRSHHDG